MKGILLAVQDGSFAREWLAENRAGRGNFERLRGQDRDHPIERVGAELRAMMPWSEEGKRKSAGAGEQENRGEETRVRSEAARRQPSGARVPDPLRR
jgi:hypothetical protein